MLGGSCPQPELLPTPAATAAHTSGHAGHGDAVAVGERALDGDTDVEGATELETDGEAAVDGDSDVVGVWTEDTDDDAVADDDGVADAEGVTVAQKDAHDVARQSQSWGQSP